MDMGACARPQMRGEARWRKGPARATLFSQSLPMGAPRQCRPAAPALDGEAPFTDSVSMMVDLLLVSALVSMTLDRLAKTPVTLHHGAGRWVYPERPIPRSKRLSQLHFSQRRRACSCSNIAITRSSRRAEAARLFDDTATLSGSWTVCRNVFLSVNCRFSLPNEFQVRTTLVEALRTGCSPFEVNGTHLSADSNSFLEKRRRGLIRFTNSLVRHPVLGQEQLVIMFLTVPTVSPSVLSTRR